MSNPIQMPALSPTMTEGKITKWLKKEGDKIAAGDAVAEVETDKSNLEVEAYDDGYLLKIVVPEGGAAPVGSPIAFIGAQGEKVDVQAATPARPAPAPAPIQAAPAPVPAVAAPLPLPPAPRAPAQVVQLRREAPSLAGRLLASPLAKKMASERGLDLAEMHGSGPQGRIVKRDVEAAATQVPAVRRTPTPAPPMGRVAPRDVPLTGMRKVIAQRMAEVKPGVPHFYLTIDVEMDAALKIRDEAKALEAKISVNDVVVKAVAMALRRYPRLNVSFAGDRAVYYENVDVGLAVAIEDGLITPVIRDADQKGLEAIAAEARELAERARKRALKPAEYSGGSITVSNLGMYGIDNFVAIINAPQSAIVAVGVVADKPVVRDGQVVIRKMMSATLSGDHRIIDGATGAEYLKELRALLEHPLRLLF
jgi:pyruvate dehydrogenase E2 component (dihydrolipoamide acetyltransferase)